MSIFPSIPRQLSCFITRELYLALPPPHDDTPETLEARDLTATAAVVRLGPANTAEAMLAVQAVATQYHAIQALQSVARCRDDFKRVGQCRAQSAAMMRQAATALRELRALQEARLTLLAIRQAELDAAQEQEAAASRQEDAAAEPETVFASPGLGNFPQAWRNEVKRRQSHDMGLRFTHRYVETHPESPLATWSEAPFMAPIPARMGAGYHASHPG